ncbi:MAG: pyruvate kinase [Gammaproteobacteria bacterium]|nr:pyruvate kinase [Gammaproteobacteria bacterium]MCW8911473.1 pyruvate kinase [Gammaproteobacteria bacterium]MCW9005281.1 pyruvate kinase [Gammaproteobacteria bacterium]MCW9055574.1 pyruvate kinase [Gammaproteobacteria bacterium]
MKNTNNNNKRLAHWRRTKIIATLGPSSDSPEIITKLVNAGVNIFRLNMSHGSNDDRLILVDNIKKVTKRLNKQVAVLVDLCGPKIRIGKLVNGKINLKEKDVVTITCGMAGATNDKIPSQYKGLYKDVKKGDRIFLDDGKLELVVRSINKKDVICKVKYGGELSDNKGMNLPDTEITAASYTEKDRKDTEFAISINADFIALSFVKDKKDILKLKKYLRSRNNEIPVVAKIERKEAINNIEEIINESYGLMVARGDLGIELPAQEVPLIQRDLIRLSRKHNRPVIVATQMLESMISNSQPTRAEVGDVANAALSSVDAVMLSAETASGKFPLKSVEMMDSILREIEAYQIKHNCFSDSNDLKEVDRMTSEREAFSYAVTSLTQSLELEAIIVPTRSGTTAVALASDRPVSPLVAVCPDNNICRRLMLHWGVMSFNLEESMTHSWKQMSKDITKKCLRGDKGKRILFVSGFNDIVELNEPVIKLVSL